MIINRGGSVRRFFAVTQTSRTPSLFQHYVYVLYPDNAVVVDGGYVFHFDKNIVTIDDRDHEGSKFDFIVSQPTIRVYQRCKPH
jgi:hypothetical protein